MSSTYTGDQERCIANLRPGYIFVTTGERLVVRASTSNDTHSKQSSNKKKNSNKYTEPKQMPIILGLQDFKDFVKYKVFRFIKYYDPYTDCKPDSELYTLFCAEYDNYIKVTRITDTFQWFKDCCGDIQKILRQKRSNALGQFAKKFKREC